MGGEPPVTEDILMEMTRTNKNSGDRCAEHKTNVGEGINTLEGKTTSKSETLRAPKIHELRGIDMQWWEVDIARYRADKKGYAYAREINKYYAELKGVEDEIKLALERGSSGAVEGAWESTTQSEVVGKEGKNTTERSTTKPDGAGEGNWESAHTDNR